MATRIMTSIGCKAPTCLSRADWEVIGADGRRWGPYCGAHSKARQKKLQEQEDHASRQATARAKAFAPKPGWCGCIGDTHTEACIQRGTFKADNER